MQCLICRGDAEYWRDIDGVPTFRCLARDCGFRFFDLARWRSPYSNSDYHAAWVPGRLDPAAPYIQARVALVRRFLAAGSVAELGCGTGETAIALSGAGFSVVAVEESAAAVD